MKSSSQVPLIRDWAIEALGEILKTINDKTLPKGKSPMDINWISLMTGSCHLDRFSIVEIGTEIWKSFFFFRLCEKKNNCCWILATFSISWRLISWIQFKKTTTKIFKIWRKFRPNEMSQTLIKNITQDQNSVEFHLWFWARNIVHNILKLFWSRCCKIDWPNGLLNWWI